MFVGYNYRYWYRYTGPVFAWYRIPESAVSLGRWTQRVKRQTPPTPSRHRRPLAGVTSRFFPLNSESVRWFTQTLKDFPSQLPGKGVSLGFCGKFLKFYLLDAEERRKEEALWALPEALLRSSHGSVRLRAPGWRPWRLCSSGAGSSVRATGMSPSPTWPRPSGTDWLSAPSSTNTDPISCEYTWNRTGERKQEISETYWLHSWLVCWQHKTIFMEDWSQWFCFRV